MITNDYDKKDILQHSLLWHGSFNLKNCYISRSFYGTRKRAEKLLDFHIVL